MNIETPGGIPLYALPKAGRCQASGKSPLDMRKCPRMAFDEKGDMCVPDLCDKYYEKRVEASVMEVVIQCYCCSRAGKIHSGGKSGSFFCNAWGTSVPGNGYCFKGEKKDTY